MTEDKPKFQPKELVFRNARWAFSRIHKAEARKGKDGKPKPGAKEKFSGTALLDPSNKDHVATILEIKQESVRALNFRYAEKITAGTMKPFTVEVLDKVASGDLSIPNFYLPWGLGNDLPKHNKKIYDGFANMFFLKLADESRPNLAAWRAGKSVPVVEGEKDCPYAGCYLAGTTTLYSYDNESRGVGANLRTLVFMKHGEAFGGGSANAEQSFAAIGDLGGAVDSSGGGGSAIVDPFSI